MRNIPIALNLSLVLFLSTHTTTRNFVSIMVVYRILKKVKIIKGSERWKWRGRKWRREWWERKEPLLFPLRGKWTIKCFRGEDMGVKNEVKIVTMCTHSHFHNDDRWDGRNSCGNAQLDDLVTFFFFFSFSSTNIIHRIFLALLNLHSLNELNSMLSIWREAWSLLTFFLLI